MAVIAFGLAGWCLCGATMGVAMAMTDLDHALQVHALAAPIIFIVLSFVYFRRNGAFSPFRTAITFLAIVFAMDFLLVALVIERSLAMFGSLIGTWLPFLLIFLSTWLTGLAMRAARQP
jgi:predicted membrane-bound spermidine synthase